MRLTDRFFRLVMVLALASVGGCGIKPTKLSPPPGVQKESFPKTYPDPATDPQPKPQAQQQQ